MQNIRKVGGGAAPSGIPVASTSNILITFPNRGLLLEPYSRLGTLDATYQSTLTPQELPTLAFNWPVEATPNTWSFLESDGDGGYNILSSNPSTNGAYIPTSGWVGQSITITAV